MSTRTWRLPKALASLSAFLLLTACSAATQLSSGSAYLSNFGGPAPTPPAAVGQNDKPLNLDEEVARIAAIEPHLRFPIRIGLARVQNGQLTSIPEEDAAMWSDLASKLGDRYGQFVVIDPMGAEFAAQSLNSPTGAMSPMQKMVRTVRLGAARQHTDAVLIYETNSVARKGDTPLQLLNWTIVGYYVVPTTTVHAQAVTNALFLDVRNGYPYATLQGKASSDTFTPGNTVNDAMSNRGEISRTASVKDLIDQIQPTLRKLANEVSSASH
jgi:hypothetical protein